MRQALDAAAILLWLLAIALAATVLFVIATTKAAGRKLRRLRYQS